MSSRNAIEVRSLVRKFGELTAVKDVTFDVRQGEIFGFLGPNGAGKTTTINILCTLLKPTSGRATVNGFDVIRQRNQVRQSIGLAPIVGVHLTPVLVLKLIPLMLLLQ